MAETESVDRMRRAAVVLRERAKDARDASGSLSRWVVSYASLTGYPQRVTNAAAVVVAETYEGGPSQEVVVHAPLPEYMAVVDPAVGLALADWLEKEARREAHHLAEFGYRVVPNEAHTLARLVLREGEGSDGG